MPSPIAQNADGHGLLVILRETLRPGDIEIEGELTVAHGHRPHRVDGVNHDIVAADQGVPVDGLFGGGDSAGKEGRG